MTTLYYVRADDFEGYPHGNDLFVRADSPEEAVHYWQDYYDTESLPEGVDEIPNEPQHGALNWALVPQVWINPEHKAK